MSKPAAVVIAVVCPPVAILLPNNSPTVPVNIASFRVCRDPPRWSILPPSPHPARSSLEIGTVLSRSIFRLSTGERIPSTTAGRLLLRLSGLTTHVLFNRCSFTPSHQQDWAGL